ncbi:MAG TPA: TetR/AcrR family transcriptional regulator [Solirubrobacterales bacterium]|nr:TetR/AcrR family transcriptional regulator [Solirubrobacterales bacterium]
MVELVAEHGYHGVTVSDLVQVAGVSNATLYKHFKGGREECFLATYDVIVNSSLQGILASMAAEGEDDWWAAARAGFVTFARQIVGNPAAACLALVEAFGAGPAALERMRRTDGLFEALLVKGFAASPDGIRLPPLLAKGIVAGAARIVRARLLAGEEERLELDAEALTEWTLSFRDPVVAEVCRTGVAGRRGQDSEPNWEGGLEHLEHTFGPSDRSLILAAAVRLALSDGYESLTVPRIRAVAGVSRRTFDTHFEGVSECFLAALELLSRRALEEAMPAYASADSWPVAVHRLIAALCDRAAADPVFARLAFIEVFSPGPAAVSWRSELIGDLAELLLHDAPPGQRPTQFAAEASVGAIWGVCHYCVSTGQAQRLPQYAPQLSLLALAPGMGAAAASAAILSEDADLSLS